jgi:exopolysaccharide biosynthesis protein
MWLAGLGALGLIVAMPPALSQGRVETAETVPDLEAEPDLGGLLDAVKHMKMVEALPGLSVGMVDYPRYGLRIHVFDFAQARFLLTVAQQETTTGSRAGEILSQSEAVFVINGGFFERARNESLSPSGLLITGGTATSDERDRAGSGILYSNAGGVGISFRNELTDRSKISDGIQVGPILVDPDGVKGIYKNVPDRYNRSAICLRDASFTAIVVEGGISLFQLADLLSLPTEDGGFGCDVAINLDGGPSTQAALRAGPMAREIYGGTSVQNFLVVSRRPTS